MQTCFYGLADYLATKIKNDEVFLANFSGEQSDFIRFNHNLIRQAGSVAQGYFQLELIKGKRHAKSICTISGQDDEDRRLVEKLLAGLREQLGDVGEDPYLLYSTKVNSSEQIGQNKLPDSRDALGEILAAAKGKDMVGLYASGGIFAGFANSLGQRNWSARHSFMLDWSFYHSTDKAVKSSYAGFEWDKAKFGQKMAGAAEQLAILALPPKTVAPGPYRVYLAPDALEEFMGMLCWGGFGLKAHKTKTTCLLKMIEQGAALHPSITLRENTRGGIAPSFQSAGFIKPDEVVMIESGKYRDCLTSPRSAREYGAAANGADEGEWPSSLDMAAGGLAQADILKKLDTGVYINTLHYLNFSDRPGCRITGMTRFATFWVEAGRIAAPLNVMRFDETAYRVLGENLLGLTTDRDFSPSTSTYEGRSTASMRLPGALVKDFTFTL